MKKTLILIVTLSALIGVAVYHQNQRNQSIQSNAAIGGQLGRQMLESLKIDDLQKVVIKQREASTTLQLVDKEWQILERNGYPAAVARLWSAARALLQGSIVNKITATESQLSQLHLGQVAGDRANNSTVEILLYTGAAEPVSHLIVGDSIQNGTSRESYAQQGHSQNRYLLNVLDPQNIWEVKAAFGEWSADPKDWLLNRFISVSAIQAVHVKGASAEEQWVLTRNDRAQSFSLLGDPSELNEDVLAAIGKTLQQSNIENVWALDEKTQSWLKNSREVIIETFDGFTYRLKIAPITTGDYTASAYCTVKVEGQFEASNDGKSTKDKEEKLNAEGQLTPSLQELSDKLNLEKKCEDWIYRIPYEAVEVLFLNREDLVKKSDPS